MAARFYGTGGLILEAAGDISADRTGLWSGSCRFRFPRGRLDLVPRIGSAHPYANFLLAERFRVAFTAGFWTASLDYAGVDASESEPTYDLSAGTGEESIETHDKFVSDIAGTPSAPKNGAIFRNQNGDVTTDNASGRFDGFALTISGGGQNPFAGCERFIAASQTTYTKSWTSKARPAGGKISIDSSPPGAPSYGGSSNWLKLPVSWQKRGGAYSNRQVWLLSGPQGWNSTIY